MSERERVVVVTGGTGGLGRWVVRAFRERGDRVHVPFRRPEGAEALRTFLAEEAGGASRDGVRLGRCDVTDAGAVDAFVRETVEASGRIDVLVNGAGGFAAGSLEETDPDAWRGMMELNATSAFLCSRAVVPAMTEAGGGRILQVASVPALEGGPDMSAYAASKAALVNLTRSLSEELMDRGITVNAVVPTVIDTPANREAMPQADRSTWLDPTEIARVILFLASEEAEIVSGAAVPLTRG